MSAATFLLSPPPMLVRIRISSVDMFRLRRRIVRKTRWWSVRSRNIEAAAPPRPHFSRPVAAHMRVRWHVLTCGLGQQGLMPADAWTATRRGNAWPEPESAFPEIA